MYPNWLQRNISKEVLQSKYLKIGFSQNGEDDFIRSFFWEEILKGQVGHYIDIGCFHETLYSNTKLLSMTGWFGVAIDANPSLKEEWISNRPRDRFVNACVDSSDTKDTSMKFYRFNDSAMNTASKERARELESQGLKIVDEIIVEKISLIEISDIARQHNGEQIDLVSIDLEMIDFLEDLPEFLIKTSPRLLCMEGVTKDVTLQSIFYSRENQKLSEANYKPIAIIGGNVFAKKNEEKILTVLG